MKAEFWRERWKQNQIGFHQLGINPHLQEFWTRLGVSAGSVVFVPLCGKSRDMLWLRGQEYVVLGVEISPIAVKSFYTENRLKPKTSPHGPFERWETDKLTILCGDFFDLKAEDLVGVAGVYDRASLIALPPIMRERYTRHLDAVLPFEAKILLVTMEYPQEEMQGPPFSVIEEEVHNLYGDRYAIERLSDTDVLNDNPRFRDRGLTWLNSKVFQLERRR